MKASTILLLCMICLYCSCAFAAKSKNAPTTTTTVAPPPKSYSKPPTSTTPVPSCPGKPKVMVPLYMAPGPEWDQVAAGARYVQTIAIINPNNGPADEVDSVYATYMQKLYDAGVVIVGYVDTNYAKRDLADVKAEIDTYASEYPLLSGVFLAHSSALTTKLPYYQDLYTYILAMPGWTYDILDPGMIPDTRFASASTHIVSLEDYGSSIASASVPSAFTCAQKGHYAAIIHSVNPNAMQTMLDALMKKQYLGYVYLSDSVTTHSKLSSYYPAMISYLSSVRA